jgi:diguanylate cyclase (GGDEF)-like protein
LTGIFVAISIIFMPRGGAFDDGVNYGLYAVAQLACSIAVLSYLRRESSYLRMRWIMFGGGIFLFAMNMTMASLIGFGVLLNGQVQSVEVLLSAIGYSLLLLSAIFMFSRATRTMAMLDTLQALLFAALRYGVIFSPKTQDLFTDLHVQISVWTPIFLFLLTRTALIGAASQAEFRLLRLISIFLGLRAVSAILQGQISYLWLHHHSTSLWDIAPILSDALFCWLAIKGLRRPLPAERTSKPPVFVRNLMPSMIAFGNLLLALLLLRYYPAQAVEAVLFTAVCYVLRTLMLQTQVNSDQVKLHERNEQLEQLVTRDTLTGTGNRRSLIAALAELTRTQARQSFGLVLMDADGFKQANDQHGHLYGDQVLVALAQVLRAAADGIPGGHCARLGGDEFALLLPGLDADNVKATAEKVRQRIGDLSMKAGDRVITVSIGVTVAQFSSGLSFETLMGRADEALYRSKSLGRNRVELWREPALPPIALLPDHAEAV